MHDRYVWIIAGGWLQLPAIEAAHSLSLKTIVSDRDSNAPAMHLADVPVPIDIYDVPAHLRAADTLKRDYDIVGVFCEGADCEVTVAELAAHLSLPGIRPGVARNCKDKVRMRACLYNVGIKSPAWTIVSQPDDFLSMPFPLMVKATDNCASRGTRRVDRPDDLPDAIADAIANSTTKTALLEEYLEGPQQSVEILFDETGAIYYLNVVDRIFEDVIELGHVNPSRLSSQEKVQLYILTHRAAQAVGVSFGAFKADTIWTERGPKILEVTARLSGGLDCQLSTPKSTGRDFIKAAMSVACGLPINPDDLSVKHSKYCAVWAAFPKPGTVKEIITGGGLLTPTEQGCFLRVQVGDSIQPYAHCAQRPGFVVTIGSTYDEALQNAQRGAAALAERIITL